MKITNKTKDYIVIVAIMIAVIWLLSGAILWVTSIFAEEKVYLTDVEKMNKFYAEESIKAEMNFLAMKQYMDNISVEEYIATFYSKEK